MGKKNKKVYASYTHRSSFYWNSELTDEEKDILLLWVKSLTQGKLKMLEMLLDDAKEATHDYCDSLYDEGGM